MENRAHWINWARHLDQQDIWNQQEIWHSDDKFFIRSSNMCMFLFCLSYCGRTTVHAWNMGDQITTMFLVFLATHRVLDGVSASSQFVANSDLGDYITQTDFNDEISSYATLSALDASISDYQQNSGLSDLLSAYVLSSNLENIGIKWTPRCYWRIPHDMTSLVVSCFKVTFVAIILTVQIGCHG